MRGRSPLIGNLAPEDTGIPAKLQLRGLSQRGIRERVGANAVGRSPPEDVASNYSVTVVSRGKSIDVGVPAATKDAIR